MECAARACGRLITHGAAELRVAHRSQKCSRNAPFPPETMGQTRLGQSSWPQQGAGACSLRLRFAQPTSGVGGATGAGAAGGGEDDDVLTALSVDEGDDDILACTSGGVPAGP